MCTVAAHCWYKRDEFARFCQQIKKKIFQEAFYGKLTKKFCHADLGYLGGLSESV